MSDTTETPTAQRIQLRQHILGMDPYVLLTIGLDDDDELKVDIAFGGGPADVSEARGVLLLALPSMGVTDEELQAVADEARALRDES